MPNHVHGVIVIVENAGAWYTGKQMNILAHDIHFFKGNQSVAKRNRRSIRLKNYDYSQPGAYFVTMCTQNRSCLFGNVVRRKMVLNKAGRMVEK